MRKFFWTSLGGLVGIFVIVAMAAALAWFVTQLA